MDSSFFLATVAAAIGCFTLFRKLSFHQQDNKDKDSSSSPSSSLSPLTAPPPSSSRIWTHHVFPSFRGEDVRRGFLSHIQMEFQRNGITPFIDNEIKRGESIGPELVRAIKGSKIAIILISRNYASSKWCLDELVEIMKSREELGQTVMAIFYKVDPSDVKKLTGDFGKVFKKTCAGKTKEDIGRWRQALAKVATIAGYHSSNWDTEAAMIKKITTDISNMLNNSISSRDFDGLVGMRARLEKMEPLLCLESDEVRMIGICGPPGIGKTTIARVAYNQLSNSFQLSVFMENIKANYTRPCSDDYSTKLQLQKLFMSQMTNQKDMEILHLGVVQDRLKDKKVLVVLDGVDHLVQLEAMAKETWWFGPGSRIIITTQDQSIFRAHGINHIYKVENPRTSEALQIFCMSAFGQKFPKHGFEELVWGIIRLAGDLPLGLRVMGSYFRGMSKQEWIKSLPRLKAKIDTDIWSILKFSYDALSDDDKYLFLHVACISNRWGFEKVEKYLGQSLSGLVEKSLISIDGDSDGRIYMHSLLVKLGREIVQQQSINEPGQRQFLIYNEEISEVLTSAAGGKSVVGIKLIYAYGEEPIVTYINERAFEGMYNLQFLSIVVPDRNTLYLPRGLNYLPPTLRYLHWWYFPTTCLPAVLNFEFLVVLRMPNSKLEKLWEGIKPLPNLESITLTGSVNLKELPDLSTAINLEELSLKGCSSLIRLHSSIGNAINLQRLYLSNCSNLLELPSSIGNAINLQSLYLDDCSNLLELPSSIGNATSLENLELSFCLNLLELPLSIGNLQKLKKLELRGCSKIEFLPTNINLESLDKLDLTDCSMLKSFPEISTNVLELSGTATEEVPPSIRSWSRLDELHMPYLENLKGMCHALDIITELHLSDTEIQEVHPWIKGISRLRKLVLKGCRKLVSLPQISDSVLFIDAEDCESLERLDCEFHNPMVSLNFAKCFKLNQEARDLIIQTPNSDYAVVPGGQVPSYFTHRAISGDSLTIKLNERWPLVTSMRFMACILVVHEGADEACQSEFCRGGYFNVNCGNCGFSFRYLDPLLTEHLYTFQVEAKVTSTSSELVFEFNLQVEDRYGWKIRECGLVQLKKSEREQGF
ncbi:unnamed protein product [Microthlaspi erraticum]|uniref:ADP-ribosyl cyclase/cyclic ADP-ribose hydrolase n=1 Tax=Microthlaspi erraticum TaxID=1685480 RepID=A0A6D2JJ18_9BRAS|nr:unnamed protein product [Microthlaspi erraticum]